MLIDFAVSDFILAEFTCCKQTSFKYFFQIFQRTVCHTKVPIQKPVTLRFGKMLVVWKKVNFFQEIYHKVKMIH